jgi:hypothetical protein
MRYVDIIPFYQKLNKKCPEGTVGQGSFCCTEECLAKETVKKERDAKIQAKKDKKVTKDATKAARDAAKKVKKERKNPELSVHVENVKSVIAKVKAEKASGKVSKETFKELKAAMKEFRAAKSGKTTAQKETVATKPKDKAQKEVAVAENVPQASSRVINSDHAVEIMKPGETWNAGLIGDIFIDDVNGDEITVTANNFTETMSKSELKKVLKEYNVSKKSNTSESRSDTKQEPVPETPKDVTNDTTTKPEPEPVEIGPSNINNKPDEVNRKDLNTNTDSATLLADTSNKIKSFVSDPESVHLDGLSDDQLKKLPDIISKLNERSKLNGIKPLKYITTVRPEDGNVSWSASMSIEGVMFLDPKQYDRKTFGDDRREHGNDILTRMKKGLQAIIDNNGVGSDGKKYDVEYAKSAIEKANKQLDDLEKSSDSGYTWTIENKAGTRPHNVSAYIDKNVDRGKLTIDHEYGHHLMNSNHKVDVAVRRAYFSEKYDKKGKEKGGDSLQCASVYGDTNCNEWFAENYALHVNNREDLVSPLLRPILKGLV